MLHYQDMVNPKATMNREPSSIIAKLAMAWTLISAFIAPAFGASTVNYSAPIGQKPLSSIDGGVLPNSNPVLIGALPSLPPESMTDSEALQFILSQWIQYGETTTRSLPLPEFPAEGLFAGSATQEDQIFNGMKIYWLVLQQSEPWNGQLIPAAVQGFALFSSSHADWVFPDPDDPSPENSVSIFSSQVDIAPRGILSGSGLQLIPVELPDPDGNPIPDGYETADFTWPPSGGFEDILAFDAAWQQSSDYVSGLPATMNLRFDRVDPNKLIIILPVDLGIAGSVFLAGSHLEFVVPDDYSNLGNVGGENGSFSIRFQQIDGPNPEEIMEDAWDRAIARIGASEDGGTTFSATTGFDNTITTGMDGIAWLAFEWDLPTDAGFPVEWSGMTLAFRRTQYLAYFTSIQRSGTSIRATYRAEPGIPVEIESSIDLSNWEPFLTVTPAEAESDLVITPSELPDSLFLRLTQELQ